MVQAEKIMSDYELDQFLNQRFFRCAFPFLSWLKEGETYWFEHKGKGHFEVRSDNNLGKEFEMEVHQLLTCFYPVQIEESDISAIKYFHWLGERGEHNSYVEDLALYLRKYRKW